MVSRPDLGDRTIFLTLPPMGETRRRPEGELWREFEIARPRILGALLDAAVRGLQALPAVRLTSMPRMADFALWATACGSALWPAGTFARAYDANRKTAVEGIIEADPVAICVRKLMAERGSWAGTASDLLRAAIGLADDDVPTNSAGWPKNPGALAGRLRRAQTFLRVLGICASYRKLRDRHRRQHSFATHISDDYGRYSRFWHRLARWVRVISASKNGVANRP